MGTRVVLCVAVVLGAAGCLGQAGTETGNPPLASLQLSLAAADVPLPAALTADPVTGVRVDEVWLSIDRIRFVQAEVCDAFDETEADLRGPLALEVAAAPQRFDLQLPAADYCRVRVQLDRAARDAGPSLLEDHAVLVTGVRGDGVPFAIRTRITPDVDVRSRGAPFPLGEGIGAVVLVFDAKSWVAAVDLATAEVAGGQIQIDGDQNETLLAAFEGAMERGLSLHDDRDFDGTLDDDETELLAGSR